MKRRPMFLLGMLIAIVIMGRASGPSDLYDNDQPKTVAYTADIVLHHQWALPRDDMPNGPEDRHEGRPATKPPMYNWIGALCVMAVGRWDEWVLKLPSVLSGLVTTALIGLGARWMLRGQKGESGEDEKWERSSAAEVGVVAVAAFLTGYSDFKLIYTARPDMVLTMFTTLGWLCATVSLLSMYEGETEEGHAGHWWFITRSARWEMNVLLWLSVAGAVLTKGPAAALVVLYIVLGAKLMTGRWSAMLRTGLLWGLPLAGLVVGLWAYRAYQQNPEHFWTVFMGKEIGERVTGGGVWGIVAELWKMPVLFMARFAPWSVAAVLLLLHVPWRKWMHHAMGPCVLWVFIVVGFFSLSNGKRADYLAPAYPAAALAAGYWLIVVGSKYGITAGRAAAAALVVGIGMVGYEATFGSAARTYFGEHVVRFAREVEEAVGREKVVFIDTGYNPLQTLLGRHQGGEPTEAELEAAEWVIQPISQPSRGDEAVLVSRPIPEVILQGQRREAAELGLFRVAGGR